MVTFVTVALFVLIRVVVAALRLAALFAFLFGRLGTPSLSLAAADTVWAEVRAAGREVLATATPTLRLVDNRRRPGLGGPLDTNNTAIIFLKLQHDTTVTKQACENNYRDERWGMRTPASSLGESSALLLHKALVAVTLQHCLSLRATALAAAPWTVLKTRLGCVSWLDNSWGGLCVKK